MGSVYRLWFGVVGFFNKNLQSVAQFGAELELFVGRRMGRWWKHFQFTNQVLKLLQQALSLGYGQFRDKVAGKSLQESQAGANRGYCISTIVARLVLRVVELLLTPLAKQTHGTTSLAHFFGGKGFNVRFIGSGRNVGLDLNQWSGPSTDEATAIQTNAMAALRRPLTSRAQPSNSRGASSSPGAMRPTFKKWRDRQMSPERKYAARAAGRRYLSLM
jgi:hypothetical protein